MKKTMLAIFLVINFWGCAANAQSGPISIQLVSMKDSGGACIYFFRVVNQSGLNITSLNFHPLEIEADGSINGSMIFIAGRLKNNEEVYTESPGSLRTPCWKIKTIKFERIHYLFVDTKPRDDLIDGVRNSINFSSKISGVKVIR